MQGDHVVNAVGSNPVEIGRLHRKNNVCYLRNKNALKAAGEMSVILSGFAFPGLFNRFFY